MLTIVTCLLSGIFFVLSVLHWYWVFGGEKGFNAAVPEQWQSTAIKIQNQTTFKLGTVIVAILLLLLSLSIISMVPQFGNFLPAWILQAILYGIMILFMLRAVGDFRTVGFFQKRTNHIFSVNDRRYYSPLCICISIMAGILLWFSAYSL